LSDQLQLFLTTRTLFFPQLSCRLKHTILMLNYLQMQTELTSALNFFTFAI